MYQSRNIPKTRKRHVSTPGKGKSKSWTQATASRKPGNKKTPPAA